MLDVSFVILDPMIADTFSVTRRAETIDSKGRPSLGSVVTPNLVGVVTQSDPSKLERKDDSGTVPRVISVVTKFAIRGLVAGFQPDLITWNGTDYLVDNVSPYSRFGGGFYEAIAASMTATDTPQ
jgi:hypothetical protein